ncbi:MAG: hypothetical protein IJW30_05085 [Clostridia bacterium]|nr:hypothetical protein [Clostridia bacterium]
MKKVTKILALSLALIMSLMMLASCGLFQAKPAKDPEDAKKALEDNGYTVYLVEDGDAATLSASKGTEEYIYIEWFENSDDAKEAYDEAKEEYDALKEAAKELDVDFEMVLGKSGKMVWSASSKDAVKAAK